MFKLKIYIVLLSLLPAYLAQAQNITGRWEGIMDDEFIQVNIEQRKNEVCGYTYDYRLANKNDHCRARFTGSYDTERSSWVLSGYEFIDNSGNHIFMRLRLIPDENTNTLKAIVMPRGFLLSFGIGGQQILLKRVASIPNKAPGDASSCFPESKAEKKREAPKKTPAPSSPKTLPTDTLKNVVPKKDSIKPVTPPKVEKDTGNIVRNMISRKQTELARLQINVKSINLKLYDNGVADNDTVSVFYNGRLLVNHQKLSEKAIELNITIDEKSPVQEITLYAENLGGIPPNTALVVITAGDKRYELRSKASLEENAVLVLEYHPPDK